MATRQCLRPLHRHYSSLFSSTTKLSHTLKTSIHTLSQAQSPQLLETPTSDLNPFCRNHFTSQRRTQGPREGDEDDDDEDEDQEEDYDDSEVPVSKSRMKIVYSSEEREKEAGEIGYKVIGPLHPTQRPFQHREPYFAVVQIGSHQFKVSNGDYIYTERLKFCHVNNKLSLSKILMVGSKSQTIIGRPILPDATVHAVVEEHALDAKVIIFKKKRRKNYRRTKGHRQELTRLRITDIQGIEKPEKPAKPEKPERRERPEKVAVAA